MFFSEEKNPKTFTSPAARGNVKPAGKLKGFGFAPGGLRLFSKKTCFVP